ncbi:hypothetical protein [Bacillus sp. NEAU-Y102]
MSHEFKGLSVGDKVFFKPDKEWYVVEDIVLDTVYATDKDGNPVSAMSEDIEY